MPGGVYVRTKEHNMNISKALTGKKLTEEHKRNVSLGQSGPKHFRWKGGVATSNEPWAIEHRKKVRKAWRRKRGSEYNKQVNFRRRFLLRVAGKLDVKLIQLVYEDNIKEYGTLTCYLCLKTIKFGFDSLDHKTPLSRGGKNSYRNLGICHLFCNKSKHNRTEKEYRRWATSR